MKRNYQMTISLVLMFLGGLICAFHVGQFSAWSECDNRYKAHISELDTNGFGAEMMNYFDSQGRHDYYIVKFVTFKPSGRLYSGSNESAVPIVGGGAVALFGLAGLLDVLLRRKSN